MNNHLSPQMVVNKKYHDVVNPVPGFGHKNENFLTKSQHIDICLIILDGKIQKLIFRQSKFYNTLSLLLFSKI